MTADDPYKQPNQTQFGAKKLNYSVHVNIDRDEVMRVVYGQCKV